MTTTATDRRVRLGIIGFGTQGSMYAKFIAEGLVPNMIIGAVADTDPARREAAAQTYDVKVHETYAELPKLATLFSYTAYCWFQPVIPDLLQVAPFSMILE